MTPTYDVTYEYYISQYYGEPVDESDFDRLLARAIDILEPLYHEQANLLYGRNDWVDENLKKAICSQIEFIQVNGGIDELLCNGGGFSLGKFSISEDTKSNPRSMMSLVSPKAVHHLTTVGLINNVVRTVQHGWY